MSSATSNLVFRDMSDFDSSYNGVIPQQDSLIPGALGLIAKHFGAYWSATEVFGQREIIRESADLAVVRQQLEKQLKKQYYTPRILNQKAPQQRRMGSSYKNG